MSYSEVARRPKERSGLCRAVADAGVALRTTNVGGVIDARCRKEVVN
jgi:hypothetical protein